MVECYKNDFCIFIGDLEIKLSGFKDIEDVGYFWYIRVVD